MARININLGTPPRGDDGDPVRTAFEKVNTMTTELYNGIDVANVSGWGKASPRIMSATDSANNLPAISGIFLFNNGGLDIPYPYVYIEQFTSGGGWIVQKAHALNSSGTWVRKYTPGNGAAGIWQLESIGAANITSNAANVNQKLRLEFRDSIGIGTPYTYCTDIDAATPAEGVILGYSYVMQDTKGTKPGGYVYGVVNTVVNTGDHRQQDFVGLNGVPGVTQRAYRRSGYGGSGAASWGPWRLVIDSASATNAVADGGVVNTSVVGSLAVTKFASGMQVVSGSLGNTGEIPANTSIDADFALPFSTGPDTTFTTVSAMLAPLVNWDYYGAIFSAVINPTTVRVRIRNGASAQAFNVRIHITGFL